MRKKFFLAALLAVVLLAVAAPAMAFEGFPDGQIIFGDDLTLESGETINGDLVIIGGDLTMEEGSTVNGEVVVFGDVEIAGTVRGNLTVFGGNAELLETAVVYGDFTIGDGTADVEEGAQIHGNQITNLDPWNWEDWEEWGEEWEDFGDWDPDISINPIPPLPPIPGVPYIHSDWGWGTGSWLFTIFVRVLQGGLTVLLMAALAGLLVVLWPQPAARVGQTCMRAPLASLGMGILTVVVVVALLISICLTIIGIPAGLVAGVAAVFGWLSLGIVVGERVMGSLTSRLVSPFWSAALGAGLVTLVSSLLYLIPCVGWLGGFLVMSLGLGAVVLTRFGSLDYPATDSDFEDEFEVAVEGE